MKKKELLDLIASLKEDVDYLSARLNALEEKLETMRGGGLNIPIAPCPPFDVTCSDKNSVECNIPAVFPTTAPVRRLG